MEAHLAFASVEPRDLAVAHQVVIDQLLGSARVTVPVPLPPGRSGFHPECSLQYMSSAGNSAFGAGWSLSGVPAVGIDDRHGHPDYGEPARYVAGGAELVPTARVIEDGDTVTRFYRARFETEFVRFERVTVGGIVFWRARHPNGVVSVFGEAADGSSRIADPADPHRTYLWLLQARYDAFGNAIRYEYIPDDLTNVDRAASFERHRLDGAAASAQRYLKTIRYGNTRPLSHDRPAPSDVEWMFTAVFDYGDHREVAPGPQPDRDWPVRPDAHSTHRPGFELRTYRMCRRVLVFAEFDELGAGATLLGSLGLEHDLDPAGSQLRRVRWTGFRRDGSHRSKPPLELGYTVARVSGALHTIDDGSRQNLPQGLTGVSYQAVDLYGEGLPGILTETADAWYYKPNLGRGRLGAQELVAHKPSASLASGAFVFSDFDRDGNPNLVLLDGRNSGFYEYDRDGRQWLSFVPFASAPRWGGEGRREWVDLDGDGRPDLVVTHPDRLVYFRSLGKEGFAAPVTVSQPAGAGGSRALAERPEVDVFFADMTGDGMLDLVRVVAGRVEYWPHLGHGQLGSPVVMDGVIDVGVERFDSRRLRFVDLDGSGTTDVVYLGSGEVRWWINASGNRLVEGGRLTGLPVFDNLSGVQVLDFVGDGSPCLVWSSPLPADAGSPVRYLRLTDGVRPRLLATVHSGLGGQTLLSYSSSSVHYVRDRDAGTPWQTRLPSHPVVVDRREVVDLVAGSRSVTRFEYHNGFFDTAERVFRGFLHVDQFDTARYDEAAPLPDADLTTPSCVRTWHHPGVFGAERAPWAAAWAGDAAEPPLAASGPESPSTLDDEAFADAYRCLAGRLVREEIFAVGPDGRPAQHPYSVTRRAYAVRQMQAPSGGFPAVLHAYQREAVGAAYEQDPTDPRVVRTIAVEVDGYGQLVRTGEVADARRVPDPAVSAQAQAITTESLTTFVHIDSDDRYLVGLPVENRDFASGELVGWDRTFYWNDAGTAALPFGLVGSVALPHHEESACFSPELIAAVFGARADEAMLREECRYRLADGFWWQPGPTRHHLGADRFHLVERVEQIDGGVLRVEYDPHDLTAISLADAAGNTSRAELDYHQLAAWRITDANGAVTEVRYDPLGVATLSTSYGRVRDPGDGTARPYGAEPLPADPPPAPSTLEEVLANPHRFLGHASRYTHHDCDAWTARGEPPASVVLTREELVHDGSGGGTEPGRVHVAVAYADGFGRVAQTKERTHPGSGSWRSSGHVVYDAKQQPVREYDPYFSDSPAYEPDPALWMHGVATRTAYDGGGRVIGRELPNGTQTRIRYAAWSVRTDDANDTVATSRYRLERETLPADDPDRQALEKALAHADTPTVVHLDPLGRQVVWVEHGRGTVVRRQITQLDHDGRPVAITDQRGLVAFRFDHDLAGRTLRERNIDAGERLTLPDALDHPVHTWDARGVHTRTTYDQLGRATQVAVDGLGLANVVERYTYGDQPGAITDAQVRNARGRLVRHEDQAGLYTVDSFTPGGEILLSTRRLRSIVDSEPDWPAGEDLEPDEYVSAARYDALGRTVQQRLPDGSVRTYAHATGGGVQQVTVSLDGGPAQEILSAVQYDARGQRLSAQLGNGATTTCEYDPETFLLRRQSTSTAAAMLQDLRLTRDPTGNVTRLLDQAQQPATATPLLVGLTVSAQRDFTYDAFYRLIEATGRVHQALLEHDYRGGTPGTFKGTRHLTLTNGGALERYTQSFRYDLAGNLEEVRHSGVTQSWRTTMWTSATSNRSLPATDPSGAPVADPESRFDAAGNTTALPHLRGLEWSYRGTLSRAVIIDRSADGGPDDDERYVYGADSMRIRKITRRLVSGEVETSEVLYLDGCEIRRVRRGGATTLARVSSDITDGVRRIATISRWSADTDAVETEDLTRQRIDYEVPDHQGSVALVLDETGAVVSYEEYFPYGGTAFLAGPAVRELRRRDHRHGGHDRDDTTGLYYRGYRYYAPWIGGWLSPDPSGPQDSLNLYEYCRNNPVNLSDPDGLQTTGELRRVGSVETGLTEAQAIARFNATRGLELGIRVTDLRPRGNDWIIVSSERLPRRLLELYRERGDMQVAELLYDVEQALEGLELDLPPGPSGGSQEGSHESTDDPNDLPPGDPGGTDPNADPNATGNGVEGADGRAADAPASTSTDRSATADAPRTGGQGDGTEAGTQAGTQGGDAGVGTRSGAGRSGDGERGRTRGTSGRPGGNPLGGTGSGGTATTGGDQTSTGTAEGTGTNGRPGAIPGGVEGGSEGGVEGGVEGGERGGQVGAEPGATSGGVSGTDGPPIDGVDPNGSPDGSRYGTRDGGPGGRDDRGSGTRSGGTSPTGRQGGDERRGDGGAAGGDPNGTSQTGEEPTTLDRIVQVAGYWHLEFGGQEGGVSGGIPGGMDIFNLGLRGAGWQIAFLALTVVDIIATIVSLGELKAAMTGLRAGLSQLVRQARHLVPLARGFIDDIVRGGAARIARLFTRRRLIDPVIDSDVLVLAWNAARRGARDPDALRALARLTDPAYQWVVTPTTFKEFVRRLPTGSASRRRFLDSLPNVEILDGARAAALRAGPRFQQVLTDLRAIANHSVPGLGDRAGSIAGRLRHTHFNDFVNSAFAEQLRIPFVTRDWGIVNFLRNHGRRVLVNVRHLSEL